VLYDHLLKDLGELFRGLASHRESQILEGRLKGDHIHMMISILPKYSISQAVIYIKGKSAIHIARNYLGKRKNFTGQHFWAKGYYVSTAGLDEEMIREYIRSDQALDRRLDQLSLFQ